MKHLFIPYELAVIAKEKGFDERCVAYFTSSKLFILREAAIHQMSQGTILAPLYQQIIDWFREKHNITIEPYSMVKSFRTISRETVYRVQRFGVKNGYRDANYTTLNKAIEEAFKL